MKIRQFTKYLFEIWRWIEKIRETIYLFLVIVGVFVFIFFFGRSEPLIRLAGYFLQLSGMGLAINGLIKLRKHFQQPTFRELFSEWWKQRPKWKKQNGIGLGSGNIGIKGEHLTGSGPWSIDNPTIRIEERIEGIVKNIETIKTILRDQTNSINKLKDDLFDIEISVSHQNKTLEKNIHSELELLHTSELFSSVVGLIWVTLGISLSTLAPEISEWFNKL